MVESLGKILSNFYKLNIYLLYDSVIVQLSFHSKEMETFVHPRSCKTMCIAALFAIAKHLKLTSEKINKFWHTYWMECQPIIERGELLYMEQHGWISKALCWMREAIYRINTVRFNLDKILEQTKCIYSDRKQISGFLDRE